MSNILCRLALAKIVSCFVISAYAQQPQLQKVGNPSSMIGFAEAKNLTESDGKIAGSWWSTPAAPCIPGAKPAGTASYDTNTVIRFIVSGTCNGQTVYFMFRDPSHVASKATCAFDYTVVGGLLGNAFTEIPQTKLSPDVIESSRKALPNFRRLFGKKQGDIVSLALLGWTDQPPSKSPADMKQQILTSLDQLREKGQLNYKVETEAVWTALDVRDYVENNKPRRDTAMNVVDGKGCLFSIKISRSLDPGDEPVWASFDKEFQRIRRVIDNYENGRPWLISGAQ